ncbi:prevent-host-death protein [Selenomonas sp. oral taxon 126]|uniref:type II toxin-antitoxin system Phd/YefM family antitoxin n=1 Tax=Selenomonas sp. oral taxon 126 TaxID=712528 RepID=UPI0008079D2B|nr:type II toxin-antitoxin system Phd/YefM family antitoxin [Selenomonas sp. oral taxon 126]ANR69884.1 prevent-host-death protein [Selenomonas sp. oral taxon 126]
MTVVNATNFRRNIFSLLEQTIKYNEPVHISTKSGNAVMLSEEDYRGLMETLYISSVPHLKDEIQEGMRTELADCIPESGIAW